MVSVKQSLSPAWRGSSRCEWMHQAFPVSYTRHISYMLPTGWRTIHSNQNYWGVQLMPLVCAGRVKRKISILVLSQKLLQPNTTHREFPVYILYCLNAKYTVTSALKFLHKLWDKWYLIHNNHGSQLTASYLISRTLVSRKDILGCRHVFHSLTPPGELLSLFHRTQFPL